LFLGIGKKLKDIQSVIIPAGPPVSGIVANPVDGDAALDGVIKKLPVAHF